MKTSAQNAVFMNITKKSTYASMRGDLKKDDVQPNVLSSRINAT